MNLKEIIFGIFLFGWFFCYMTFVVPKKKNIERLEKELRILEQQQVEQKDAISKLRIEYSQFQQNAPEVVEKVLRERYGYCKEGETICIFK